MAAYAQDSTFFTRRGIVVVVIIALHVAVAWALHTGLAQKVISLVAPPIEADLVEDVKQDDEPPPPPPPEMERPPVEVPPPEIAIDLPMETTTTAIQDVTDRPPPPAPPPPVPRVAGTSAKVRSSPDVDRFYPPGAKRREETGSPTVQACVGPNGRLLRDPVVTETSGYPELDTAAVQVAKASRYTPATEGGQAVDESCVKYRVKFVIKNE